MDGGQEGMKTFVERAAAELYARYGAGISQMNLVFPNKRARLFFNEALSRQIDAPLWQPSYISIDDLVRELSSLTLADNLRLVTELYKIYNEIHPEPFDKFYQWGVLLLADFDMVDKYLIDPRRLYTNIGDLKEIDAYFEKEGFDQHGMELAKQFWRTFNESKTESREQKNFIGIWQSLADIYRKFNERLCEIGIGYSGMIYRDVAERIKTADGAELFTGSNYCFLGFNALNECEKRLFAYMKDQAGALFVWDYDNYYLQAGGQEAGRFLRRNIASYGESIPIPSDNFVRPKTVEVISSPSDILQCKALYLELQDIYRRQGFVDKETAVVLTDENLLIPVLHSIPPEVDKINITMGYPLTGTVPYVLLERLLLLQERRKGSDFYHSDVQGILSHPYILEHGISLTTDINAEVASQGLLYVSAERFAHDKFLGLIFRPVSGIFELQDYLVGVLEKCSPENPAEDEELPRQQKERIEFLFVIISAILKLKSSIAQSGITLSSGVYSSLLRQMLRAQRIPYEGEPLGGLQIMGILETRNLDFENIIFLSMGDDTFPGNRGGSSYIPFNLRQAYGLPTIADHEAMYGYYFYRGIQRCSNLTMMYNSSSEDQRSGEPSRYIYQLDYESPHEVVRRNINLKIGRTEPAAINEPKTDAVLERLSGMAFSPSQVNRYVDCPLKFYFSEIQRLRPLDKIEEDITRLDVGNVLHKTLELIYRPLIGDPDPRPRLGEVLKDRRTQNDLIDQAFAEIIGARNSDESRAGRIDMVRDVILRLVERIVSFDASFASPFVVENCEIPVKETLKLEGMDVRMRGVIDRLDRIPDGAAPGVDLVRIVDYKSGQGDSPLFGEIESLFTDTDPREVASPGALKYRKHNSAALQTLIYGVLLTENCPGPGHHYLPRVSPALYITKSMNDPQFDPRLIRQDTSVRGGDKSVVAYMYDELVVEMKENLDKVFSEIFNPAVPFSQTPYVDEKCGYCDFRAICRR